MDIDLQYDSGDGTHLNDAGHAILVNRVIDNGIPFLLADTLPVPDHVLTDFYLSSDIQCDSFAIVNAVVANRGITGTASLSVNFALTDNSALISTNSIAPLAGMVDACRYDTVSFTVAIYDGGAWSTSAHVLLSGDVDASIDTSSALTFTSVPFRIVQGENDTVESERHHW